LTLETVRSFFQKKDALFVLQWQWDEVRKKRLRGCAGEKGFSSAGVPPFEGAGGARRIGRLPKPAWKRIFRPPEWEGVENERRYSSQGS
jgi:hypothetical protein